MANTRFLNLELLESQGLTLAELVSKINDSLEKIDTHNHTQAREIPLSSIVSNADLGMNENAVINIDYLNFLNRVPSVPTNGSVYFKDGELFVRDFSGREIQVTHEGGNFTNIPGNAKGDLWASAPIKTGAVASGAVLNGDWTTAEALPSEVALNGTDKIRIPNVPTDPSFIGFWVDVAVSGSVIDSVFVPWKLETAQDILLTNTNTAEIMLVNNSGRQDFDLFIDSKGQQAGANTEVRVYPAVIRGARGQQGPPGAVGNLDFSLPAVSTQEDVKFFVQESSTGITNITPVARPANVSNNLGPEVWVAGSLGTTLVPLDDNIKAIGDAGVLYKDRRTKTVKNIWLGSTEYSVNWQVEDGSVAGVTTDFSALNNKLPAGPWNNLKVEFTDGTFTPQVGTGTKLGTLDRSQLHDILDVKGIAPTKENIYQAEKSILKAGTNVTITPDDGRNELTISSIQEAATNIKANLEGLSGDDRLDVSAVKGAGTSGGIRANTDEIEDIKREINYNTNLVPRTSQEFTSLNFIEFPTDPVLDTTATYRLTVGDYGTKEFTGAQVLAKLSASLTNTPDNDNSIAIEYIQPDSFNGIIVHLGRSATNILIISIEDANYNAGTKSFSGSGSATVGVIDLTLERGEPAWEGWATRGDNTQIPAGKLTNTPAPDLSSVNSDIRQIEGETEDIREDITYDQTFSSASVRSTNLNFLNFPGNPTLVAGATYQLNLSPHYGTQKFTADEILAKTASTTAVQPSSANSVGVDFHYGSPPPIIVHLGRTATNTLLIAIEEANYDYDDDNLTGRGMPFNTSLTATLKGGEDAWASWASRGNTDAIPASKLANAPSGGGVAGTTGRESTFTPSLASGLWTTEQTVALASVSIDSAQGISLSGNTITFTKAGMYIIEGSFFVVSAQSGSNSLNTRSYPEFYTKINGVKDISSDASFYVRGAGTFNGAGGSDHSYKVTHAKKIDANDTLTFHALAKHSLSEGLLSIDGTQSQFKIVSVEGLKGDRGEQGVRGETIQVLTPAQYTALAVKDANTLYGTT